MLTLVEGAFHELFERWGFNQICEVLLEQVGAFAESLLAILS